MLQEHCSRAGCLCTGKKTIPQRKTAESVTGEVKCNAFDALLQGSKGSPRSENQRKNTTSEENAKDLRSKIRQHVHLYQASITVSKTKKSQYPEGLSRNVVGGGSGGGGKITTMITTMTKETMITTYKTIYRSILEYGGPLWHPRASSTNWH